jgi:hypothetical protein
MTFSLFWDITPRNPVKDNRRFGGIYCPIFRVEGKAKHHARFILPFIFDTEDGAVRSSEKSVDFQQITRRYIPEGTV